MGSIHITTDIFFRYLFADRDSSHLLLAFINAVLSDSGFTPVASVEVINPFNIADLSTLKESIVDVKARDADGRIYDIEVQVGEQRDFANRSLYYWANNYAGQLERSIQYGKLKPVICINILNFRLIQGTDKVHTCFMLKEKNDASLFMSDHLQIHFLQMPLITETLKNQVKEELYNWLAFFKDGDIEESFMKYAITDSIVLEAQEKYRHFTESDKLREAYEAHMKWIRDYNAMQEYAIEKGMQQGLEQGLQQGSRERAEQTALALLNMGLSRDQIAQAVQLPLSRIEELDRNR